MRRTGPITQATTTTLITTLTFVLVFLSSFIKILDYDIWFHLESGEYIIANLSIPATDPFSYTAYGNPWITHEWLSGVVFYLVWLAAGFSGLTFFKTTIITAVFAVSFLSLREKGIATFIALSIIALSALIAKERYIERPELFTYLFTAIFIYILETRKGLLYLPLLSALWANMHSGVVFGLAIAGLYTAAALSKDILPALKARRASFSMLSKDSKKLAGAFFLSLCAALINPNTYMVYTYPFTALDISSGSGLDIAEYSPPTFAADTLFFTALFLFTLVFALNIKKARAEHVLIFILFSILALKFNRSIALWAIIASFLAPIYLDMSLKRKPRTALAVLIALIIVSSTLVPHIVRMAKTGFLGAGILEGRFPEGAVRFLEREDIKGNMYNSYELGGYLIWRTYPERKVYIDGRSDIYRGLLDEQRVLSALGFENIIEKYDINYAIMSYSPSNTEYISPNPIFGGMLALVWWDDTAMIYLKRTADNMPIIEKLEYKFIRPTDTGLIFTDTSQPHALIADIERNIRETGPGERNLLLLKKINERIGN
ncbi:MAG: hypothetical protein HY880_08420 [Deltaproteobacteria bacterium]|nr:hypothetical protein [Deltaproteobacteria bacterium]